MSSLADSESRSVRAHLATPRFLFTRRRLLVAIFAVGLAVASARGIVGTASAAVEEPPQKAIPEINFKDAAGSDRSLATFRGRFVLLNVWATWCLPCRQEMPALDRLQSKLGGVDFEVVALSIDRRGIEAINDFFARNKITKLATFNDPSGVAKNVLAVFGIPTTLLIDREGREVQRWVGPVEWDSPEIVSLIVARLSAKANEQQP